MGTVGTSYCGGRLLGISIAIAAVQIIVVPARFYTRYIQRTKCTLDDYLILPALIACLGQSALYIVAGLGYHFEYVQQTPEKLVAPQKRYLSTCRVSSQTRSWDFPFTVTPAKLSILLFYLRIFQTRTFQILSYATGFLVLGHGIGVFLAAIFQCLPVQYTWDKEIPGGSCFNQQAFYRYASPPNTFTDLIILVMLMPVLAITGVFLLGGLGLVTSILHMVAFFQESVLTDSDLPGTSVNLGVWTVLEGGIIIMAACLPPIWPLIVRYLPTKVMREHRNRAADAQGRLYTGTSQLKRSRGRVQE
ncbi:hypothetical protein BDV10DRAFT_201439 [Aspergillus recurvatus]